MRQHIHEDYEVEYGGVSKERLEQLVKDHGNHADDVRRALGRRHA